MIDIARRSVAIGTAVAAVLVLSAPMAGATEVDDVLERARSATYTATRLTVSVWGDQTNVTRERVEHAAGAEMVRVDETWSMVGNGRTVVMGDAPEGIAFMTRGASVSTDRYAIGDEAPCRHLRRQCSFIAITEGDRTRAKVLVDTRTGAPLITYVYDGDGRTYRTVSLSDFSPHRTYEWGTDPTTVPVEIVMHDESRTVPAAVFGYQIVDVFPGPASSEQGYYSDGLFSFSLFAMPLSTTVEGFEEPSTLITEAGAYDVLTTARDVRVHWSSADHHYVLVGDLPPDHLESVLAELPHPDRAGVLARLWRALFG